MNGYRWLPYFVIFRFAIELRHLFFQISKKGNYFRDVNFEEEQEIFYCL